MAGLQARWSTDSIQTVALVLSTITYFTVSGISFPVLPRLVDEVVGGQESEVGLTFAAFSIGLLVIRPFVSFFVDRFGRRWVIVAGALIAAVTQLLYVPAAEVGIWPLLLARFASGLGGSGMYVALATVATELPPPQRRAQVFALFAASTYVGFALGPLIGETIYASSGFTAVYTVAAALATLPTLLIWLCRETRPADVDPKIGSLRTLLHPVGAKLGIGSLVVVIAFMSFSAFVTDWTIELGGTSARWALFAFSVTALLMRVGAGRLLDGNRLLIGTLGYIGTIAGAIALASAPSVFWIYPAAILLAMGVAYIGPLLVLIGADSTADAERAKVVGTVTFFNDVGASLMLPVLGYVAETLGFRAMFGIVAAVGVLALGYFRSPTIAGLSGLNTKHS